MTIPDSLQTLGRWVFSEGFELVPSNIGHFDNTTLISYLRSQQNPYQLTPKANTPLLMAVTNGGGVEVLAEMYPALMGETIQANKQKQDIVNVDALTYAMDLSENLEQWSRLAAAAGGALRSPPTAFPQLEK
ncbi:hypothetical protein TL16_g09832 [Triparma laevis f. inornata]|uniref:Uncharacterized protein n=2 Tax=Triparma laevis TaxID=1534972 RepID=A0A9W7C1X2_9STRA|nr:hypothetical protein TL16_g09832 [Triparma laevis f. inornata]GMI01205.1 hypothetical protein TrLO_g9505 [Triparma laevis f. longispina]